MSVRRKEYEITAVIPDLSDSEYERLRAQLDRWFRLSPGILKRTDNQLVFDAVNAGSGANMLAARVEAFFIGYLLGRG